MEYVRSNRGAFKLIHGNHFYVLEILLSGGVIVRGVFVLGGNCPGGNCPGVIVRGVIVRGVIVRGVIVLEP